MAQQAVLDFARADPVAGRLEHIVGPSGVPEVAVGVDAGQVARAAPVAGELGGDGGLVAPVAQEQHRVGEPVDIEPVDATSPVSPGLTGWPASSMTATWWPG